MKNFFARTKPSLQEQQQQTPADLSFTRDTDQTDTESRHGDPLDKEVKHGYATTTSAEGFTTDVDDTVHDNVNVITKLEAATEIAKDETAAHEGEDDLPMPSGFALLMITLGLCLSVFCLALDNTIIATAIPVITNQFHSVGDVGWYGSSYLLCTCAFQLFFGKLYKFYSIKLVYLIALGIFELGSLICGAAPSSTALIVGRAVAGLGAAGIFSGAMLIIAHSVALAKRPVYMGLIGAMYGIASVAGPLLGGVFTDKVTWRLCFYINLPIGFFTVVFIIFFFKSPGKKLDPSQRISWVEQLKELDLEGLAAFLPGIISLLLALQWGGVTYAWKSARIIVLFVVFAVCMAVFIGIQIWKQEKATLPPRLVKMRSVWSASWFSFCIGGAFFIPVYFISIWFQAIKGASPVQSGIDNIPMVLGLVVVSIIAGGGVTALGYYTPFCIMSAILTAVGAGLLSTFQVHTAHPSWIGFQVLFGAGIGLGMQLPMIAIQASLSPEDIPTGTSAVIFAQTIGGSILLVVAQNIFNNELVNNLQKLVPNLSPDIVLVTGATALRSNPSLTVYMDKILVAYNIAITRCFYPSVALGGLGLLGALAMEWKSVKGKKLDMAAA